MKQYSQIRAMLAVTKASLIATFRSPQSIFFSLFFPIVLIWIFGSLSGGDGVASTDVAWEKGADSTSALYQEIAHSNAFHFVDPTKKDIEDELRKGRIAGIISVAKQPDTARTPYAVNIRTSTASVREFEQLQNSLNAVIHRLDATLYHNQPTTASLRVTQFSGRQYKMISTLR